MIALTNYLDLPCLIFASSHINHHIGMHQDDSNCTSRMNWFYLTRTPCVVFEPEPLNAFESIEDILAANFEEEPLEAYFCELLDIPSSWNIYWTDSAREGGGLDIYRPVFGQRWTNYHGLHLGLFTNCDPEEVCDCEGHNCVVAQSTVGHAASAATIAKSLRSALIVIVPPTPTHYKIDTYNWHW